MKKKFLILDLFIFLLFFNFILNNLTLAAEEGEIYVTFTTVTVSICPPGILGKGACEFPSIIDVIQKIVDLIIEIAPLVFVIIVILGGFMYLLSPIQFEKIVKGHKYIQWAIYGFALILIASLIFEFIANIFGGPKS